MFFILSLVSFFHSPQVIASAFEPAAKWDHLQVRVCILTRDSLLRNPDLSSEDIGVDADSVFFPESLAHLIKEKVLSEFTSTETGIHFSGFEKCALNSEMEIINGDALLVFQRSNAFDEVIEGEGSIGLSTIDIFKGEIVRRTQNDLGLPTVVMNLPEQSRFQGSKLTFENAVLATALHEFGHLAGLHHEHTAFLSDALSDPHCLTSGYASQLKTDPNSLIQSLPAYYRENLSELKSAIRSTYDSASIMNYCQVFQLAENGLRFRATPHPSLNGYGTTSDHRTLNLNDSSVFTFLNGTVTSRIMLSKKDRQMLRKSYLDR